MLQIDLDPVPSQIVKFLVDDQQVQMLVQQKPQGIFVDINLNGVDIVNAVLAQNENKLVCREYMGFKGNLFFVDTDGNKDPEYTGLGTRFNLIYLDAEEYELVPK